MRVALLAPPFKVAVLNRYCPKFDVVAASGIGAFHLDLIDILQKCQHVPYTTHELSASSNHRIPTEDCVGLEKDLPDQLDLSRQYLTRASGPVSELASLSEFVPVTELVSESEVFTRECDDDVTFSSAIGNTPHLSNCGTSFDAVEEDWNLPKSLRVKCPRKGRVADFIRPQAVDGHFDFYPMDLGSVIAVLALNLSPQDTLLDLCAAPGGKAVAALQTLQLREFFILIFVGLCSVLFHQRLTFIFIIQVK
ncbi:unnamed protein product [Dicrocoelium dendriticum]|nr:unnamed protein product [Dicrocoelium dendriticum]